MNKTEILRAAYAGEAIRVGRRERSCEPQSFSPCHDISMAMTPGDVSVCPSPSVQSRASSSPPVFARNGGAVSCSALADFRAQLCKREGNIARAWRLLLDPHGAGRLAQAEFCAAARRFGYSGNIRGVWDELDTCGVGMVTLLELDWSTADILGRFYQNCVKRFGSVERAAQSLELRDARRMSREAFVARVLARGLADERDAEQLFQMLRSSATGDSRPALTREELLWLGKVGEYLPKPVSRVRPGALQEAEVVAAPCIKDDAVDLSWGVARSARSPLDAKDMEGSKAFRGLGCCRPARSMSASAMGRHAENSPASTSSLSSEGTWDYRVGETVHERLYREGFESQQRARDVELARSLKPARMPILDANPEVFNRLHEEYERMQERKRDRAEQQEEVLAPHQDGRRCREQDGLVCHDKEVFSRLVRTREKSEPARAAPKPAHVRENPSHRCINLYNAHRERAKAAEKDRAEVAEKIAKEASVSKRNQRAPDFGRLQRLHDYQAKREDKLRQQREQALAAEAESFTKPRGKNGPMRSDGFLRLHMEAMQRNFQIAQKKAQAEREEEAKLKGMSVHRRVVGDTGVFERLYGQSRIEEPELEVEEGPPVPVWRPPPMVKLPSAAEVTQQVFAELGLSLDVESDGQDQENDYSDEMADQCSESMADSCSTTDAESSCCAPSKQVSRRPSSANSTCSTRASSRCAAPPRSCKPKHGCGVDPSSLRGCVSGLPTTQLRTRAPVHRERT